METLKPKFLLSENLNRLARYLRMMGYDAVVYKSISFSNKIRLVNKDRRIYLTRSPKESKSNQKFNRFLIKSVKIDEQLKEIKKYITFPNDFLFSRCIECNKLLYQIDKGKISNLVPEYILQNHNDFLVCRKCGKIYWKGTHYQDMMKKLSEL
ncbi:MAG: Mut7-C RNAse domain-containing protein [Candidatus Cloacimonetes bacterium]|nr:Mut7-C RNAse domain-containing protein [Candidatus Cloacimonadota bacterium]